MSRHGMSEEPRLTLRDFEELPEESLYRLELVEGLVVREPRPAPLHARVLTRIIVAVDNHVRRNQRGVVLTDCGFLIEETPPTVRIPDVSVVLNDRIPAEGYGIGFWPMA